MAAPPTQQPSRVVGCKVILTGRIARGPACLPSQTFLSAEPTATKTATSRRSHKTAAVIFAGIGKSRPCCRRRAAEEKETFLLASLLVLSFLSYMFFRLKSPGPREDREPHGYDASCAGERREETRGREEKRQRLGAGFRVLGFRVLGFRVLGYRCKA